MTDSRLLAALRLLGEVDGALFELAGELQNRKRFADRAALDRVAPLRVKIQAAARIVSREIEARQSPIDMPELDRRGLSA